MDIKIKIIIKDKPNLLANANISFDTVAFGSITIKNFAIWKSQHFNARLQEQINITPPSTRGFKYTAIVFFENRDKWYELEQQIYDAFNAVRQNPEEENIDPDEVDIGIAAMRQEDKQDGY